MTLRENVMDAAEQRLRDLVEKLEAQRRDPNTTPTVRDIVEIQVAAYRHAAEIIAELRSRTK